MTYDDPEGRREKAKLLARIERYICVVWTCIHVSATCTCIYTAFVHILHCVDIEYIAYPLSYREEEMRAQGLDPAQFRDSSSVDDRILRLDLLGSDIESTTTSTRGGERNSRESRQDYTAGQQVNGNSDTVGLGNGGKSTLIAGFGTSDVCGVEDKDKDTPSSTPLPPPLGMPIVTHAKGRKEGMYTVLTLHMLSFCMVFTNCSEISL